MPPVGAQLTRASQATNRFGVPSRRCDVWWSHLVIRLSASAVTGVTTSSDRTTVARGKAIAAP